MNRVESFRHDLIVSLMIFNTTAEVSDVKGQLTEHLPAVHDMWKSTVTPTQALHRQNKVTPPHPAPIPFPAVASKCIRLGGWSKLALCSVQEQKRFVPVLGISPKQISLLGMFSAVIRQSSV